MRQRSARWVDGVTAGMPAADGAAVVLRARLKALEKLLPLAARTRGDDPEPVHQLRVATRRAAAALRLFGPCLDRGVRRKLRRVARRIRRAAAEARDADVQRQLAMERATLLQGPGEAVMRDLAEWLGRRGRRARRSIRAVTERYPSKRLRRLRRRVLAGLGPVPATDPAGGSPPRLGEFAAERLARRATAVEEASRADLRIVENLHALRLEGKRLRYEMESVAVALGPDVQEACGRLKALQDRLGAINDVAGLRASLERRLARAAWSDVRRGAANRLSMELAREQAERTDAFLREWRGGSAEAVRDIPRVARSPNGESAGPRPGQAARMGEAPGEAR
jgi:CHAD domain-containing protein